MHRPIVPMLLPLVVSCLLNGFGVHAEDEPAVRVHYMQPVVGDELLGDLPEWMNGIAVYSQPDKSQERAEGVSGREVIFDVVKPTTVLVLASWAYDGNRSGGWYEDRSSLESLQKQGWQSIGKVQRRQKAESPLEDFHILRRDCRPGESFRFHTRKYNPPFVAMLPAGRQSMIPGVKPSPDNAPNAHSATVHVKCMKPAENHDAWIGLPAWMKNGTIYSQVDKTQTRGEGVSGREVLFEVLRPTTVIVLASWVEQGSRRGGWFENRSGLSDLKKLGWQRIGEAKHQTAGGSQDLHQILRRDCKAGEKFRFHTRKYTPPFVVVLPDDQLASIPGGDKPSDDAPKMVQKQPADSSPRATKQTAAESPKPAVPQDSIVNVKFMKPVVGDESWVDTPGWLDRATIYSETDREAKRPEGVSSREVLFEVRKPSTILLLASWTYDGSPNDGWTSTRWSIDRLIESGWSPIAKVRRRKKGDNLDDFTVFRRDCKAGESFRLHTRKYGPPFVAIVPPEQVAAIPTDNPVLATACILPPVSEAKTGRWKNAEAATRTVLLKARDPQPDEVVGFGGMLQREIIRQAILLAAREELGLSTRDSMLREDFPDNSQGRAPLEVIVAGTTTRRLKTTIFRAADSDWQILWNDRFPVDDEGPVLDQVLEHAEQLSRTQFPDVLLKAGYEKGTKTRQGDARLDDETVDLLDAFQTVAQFGVVRRLHKQIREEGESVQLLDGLARGYANLGVLAEPLWSPVEKVFKARALLYAQRAVQLAPKSPTPYITRAHIWLLCGIHQFAQDSLESASRLESETSSETDGKNTATRRDVLHAAANSDATRLQELDANRNLRPLVRLLLFQAIEPTSQSAMLKQRSAALLEEQPHSLRPLARLMKHKQMGPRTNAIRESLTRFPRGLYTTLELVPDMPNEILDRIERELPNFEDGFDITEIDLRRRVIRDLNQMGTAENDQHEPSMAVLGKLIHEFGFLHSTTSLYYQKYSQGVDVDYSIPTFRRIVAGHPYAEYIEAFSSDPARRRQVLQELVDRIDPAGLNAPTLEMLEEIWRSLDYQAYKKLVRHLNQHRDETLRELYNQIVTLDKQRSTGLIQTRLVQLRQSCPNHPLTAAMTLQFDRETARPFVEKWEERYADHTLVHYWLADFHQKDGDNEAWERILRRGLEVSPHQDSYERLAGMYYERGDEEQWKSTLEEMLLKTEPEGLDHAYARHRIAKYLMRKQKFEEALPYAQEAADSYSGWSLYGLSACLEGLGRLEESEKVLQALVYRYDNNGIEWLQWCVRNGQGDKESARRAALQDINSYPRDPSASQLSLIAEYYLLTDDAAEALANFEKSWRKERSLIRGAMAAALAHQLGKANHRDRLLQEVINHKPHLAASSVRGSFCDLMKVIKDGLQNDTIDIKRAETIIENADLTLKSACSYFLALFLDKQSQKEATIKLMTYAATSPNVEYVRGHAMSWLRKRKIPFGKPRPLETPNE